MPGDVGDALADLARAFAAARVRWYVFGAQAVAAAGVPRFTADIAVTVEVPAVGVRALVSALGTHGFVMRNVGDVSTFIAETRVVPVDHVASKLPVDIVLAGAEDAGGPAQGPGGRARADPRSRARPVDRGRARAHRDARWSRR